MALLVQKLSLTSSASSFPCLLQEAGVAWTSIRPVYIYGPLNYNPVEEWFFHRIKAGRPIPVPGSGMQVESPRHALWEDAP